jgi:ribosomal protein S18 acetylase RimI-like enzyme
MVIREWTVEDLPAVQHITWETWVATYASFIPIEDLRAYYDEQYSIEALKKLMEPPTFRGFLAVEEGVPAGYAKTKYDEEEKRCYLSSLYILPGYQGRGIGGRLLAVGEAFARTFGVTEIWLGVMVQNTSALAWYRKLGFQFVEEAPFTMGKTTVSHLIGYRELGAPAAAPSRNAEPG